jgi:hypothetical protein
MTVHSFGVSIGDQVFVGKGEEEVGAVREVARDHLVIYIEGAGDFRIEGPTVLAVHDGKVVLDPTKLDARLASAIEGAHGAETD